MFMRFVPWHLQAFFVVWCQSPPVASTTQTLSVFWTALQHMDFGIKILSKKVFGPSGNRRQLEPQLPSFTRRLRGRSQTSSLGRVKHSRDIWGFWAFWVKVQESFHMPKLHTP